MEAIAKRLWPEVASPLIPLRKHGLIFGKRLTPSWRRSRPARSTHPPELRQVQTAYRLFSDLANLRIKSKYRDDLENLMSAGNEIRLYDYYRTPRCWSDIILPTQCAALLRNDQWGTSVDRNGKPRTADNATCILFDSIEDAERFCRQMVAEHPMVSCEVLDAGGRLNPPLLIVMHQHVGGDDDVRGWFAHHRRLVMAILFAASLPLFWLDWSGR